MAERPLISIAVPVFNGASHLRACLTSILAQDVRSLEVVVSDGGSSDESFAILRTREDPRIRLLPTLDKPNGLHANWSRVLSESRGEYVKLVCQDDLLVPGCLRRQADLLRTHPSSALVAGRRNIIDEHDRVLIRDMGLGRLGRNAETSEVPTDDVIRACIRAGTNLLGEPASVMFRRSALPSPLISYQWHYAIDIDLYVRAAKGSQVVIDRRVSAAFRVAPTQLSVKLAHEQAREMRRYIRYLSAEHQDVARPTEVRIGTARATILSTARRGLYAALLLESKLRMNRVRDTIGECS